MSMIMQNYELAQVYWIFAGGAIVIAGLVNLKEKLIYRNRLAEAAKSSVDPARPKHPALKAWATITAISREMFSAAPPAIFPKYPQLNIPPLGPMLLIAANIALLLSITFWKFDLNYNRAWEDIGMRAAWMTMAQLPLVFLMAGKRNIVGFISGSSYERLQWIHRWVARCLFITATIHMAYFMKSWDRSNYVKIKLETDIISRTGLGAWCVLLWIILSSFAPIRNVRYEFFVIQHVISYIGFITMVIIHSPARAHKWVWAPIALYFFDKLARYAYLLYNNLSIFHPKKTSTTASKLLTCKATFMALPDRATQITIKNPTFTWAPGQHVFLSCPTLLPLQSHPFTIASLPSDNECVFVVRAHRGGTHRLFRHAKTCLPPLDGKAVIIDGPYGRTRPLEQFDTVTLIAGSTGATFTTPLLRDLVRRARNGDPLVTTRVKLIWVVKNRSQIEWFLKELCEVFSTATNGNLDVEASIYVTCDDTLTKDHPLLGSEGSSVLDMMMERNSRGSGSSSTASDDEKKPRFDDSFVEDSSDPNSSPMCGGDTCCCTATIQDEDAILPSSLSAAGGVTCQCNKNNATTSNTSTNNNTTNNNITNEKGKRSSGTPTSASARSAIPAQVHLFTGRPAVKTLIKKELERAAGEAAVVACGPRGLVGLVRESVVALSDERAVCKGSGAMGVYLHTEAFGW
ncbi:ferric reductase NAD binding domain-containing protein [Peziza echinospora]|nr:ferric reductase NAD binding domain-containing protein [Peziza echinospora]